MKREGTAFDKPTVKRKKTDDDAQQKTKQLDALRASLDEQLKNLEGTDLDVEVVVKPILKKAGAKKSRKKVSFSVATKTEDGNTARLYSRPEFLKQEGGFLRPKTKEEIESEIRQGLISDHVREINVVVLEEDSSEDEPYDPNKPNNYEEYCRELARRKSREQRLQRDRGETQRAAQDAARLLAQQNRVIDKIDRNLRSMEPKKPPRGYGEKMMKKWGWKKGEGLGSKLQGVKGALAPGRNNVLTMVMDTSRILRLQNMVGPGDVDEDLRKEVGQECSKFGTVVNVIVHETKNKSVSAEHAVNVFVEFVMPQQCEFAIQSFNGRFFGGRRVIGSFFPEERYNERDLDPHESIDLS